MSGWEENVLRHNVNVLRHDVTVEWVMMLEPDIKVDCMDFQCKHVAVAAEAAMENSTGCAWTEGMHAIAERGEVAAYSLVCSADEEVLLIFER